MKVKVGDTLVATQDMFNAYEEKYITKYGIYEVYHVGNYYFTIVNNLDESQTFNLKSIDSANGYHLFDTLQNVRIKKIKSIYSIL